MISVANRLNFVRTPLLNAQTSIHHDESLTGWLGRVSASFGLPDWMQFTEAVGGDSRSLYEGDAEAIRWLSNLTEMPLLALQASATCLIDDKVARIRNAEVDCRSLVRGRPRYCHHCFEDDIAYGRPPYLRSHWEYTEYKACHLHSHSLIEFGKFERRETLGDILYRILINFAGTVPILKRVQASKFEKYVYDSVCSKQDALYNFTLDELYFCSRDIGIAVTNPGSVKLWNIDDDERRNAASFGFEILSEGATFIEGVMASHITGQFDSLSGFGAAAPHSFIGLLVDCMDKIATKDKNNPVVEAVRNAVVATLPIKSGSSVFGSIQRKRALHSLTSLHQKTACGWSNGRRILLESGLIDDQVASRIPRAIIVPAELAEQAVQDASNTLTVIEAGQYLGVRVIPLNGCSKRISSSPTEPGGTVHIHVFIGTLSRNYWISYLGTLSQSRKTNVVLSQWTP